MKLHLHVKGLQLRLLELAVLLHKDFHHILPRNFTGRSFWNCIHNDYTLWDFEL